MDLTPTGQRVLGCLLEKSLATPQQYPLSINALQNACNQRTGREPVVDYDEDTVRAGLDDLKRHELVRAEYARSSRTPKYAHRLGEQLDLSQEQLAVLTLLLLRGPQTPGEMRNRSDRLHPFENLRSVDETMEALASHRFGPLAVLLPRAPGQKEARWAHLLGGDIPTGAAAGASGPQDGGGEDDLAARVRDLEATVARLTADVDGLRAVVTELRGQAGS